MNITISARHSSIPETTKDYAREKAEKLEKFYRLRKIDIVMDVEGDNYIVEIVASPEKGGKSIVSTAKTPEWFPAIDQATDKVERQLRKIKSKEKSHRMKKYKEKKEDPQTSSNKEETYEDVIDKMD